MLNDEPWHGQGTSASAGHFTAGTPDCAFTFSGSTQPDLLAGFRGADAVASTELAGLAQTGLAFV